MEKWMPIMGTGLAIQMCFLNEEQAQRNHGQSLTRLAERGGLCLQETIAVLERREYRRQTSEEALQDLINAGSNIKLSAAALKTE